MSFKKLLGIISIVIIVVFSMMLTTSYAWYSFENASTVFEAVTNNDDIVISYQRSEYINTSIAVPISSELIDKYSEKNEFSINVKKESKDFELLVTVSLIEISIDEALKDANFMVDLLYQDEVVASFSGDMLLDDGDDIKEFATVSLDNDISNDFILRVYILDNGADQSAMMEKTFSAKIQANVVSRVKANVRDYSGSDIFVSSIIIDGEEKNYLPPYGYYDMTYTCTNGSKLTWDPLNKKLTYNKGSNIKDDCKLVFVSVDNKKEYPLLNEMPVGSYVKYVGSNGCDGRSCEGNNINYVSDKNMGYCSNSNHKLNVNGWRIGYIEDGSAYLISAGTPECVKTNVESKSTNTSSINLSEGNYYYGTGYKFDKTTGTYSLTNATDNALIWKDDYKTIIKDTPYTCKATSLTDTCTTMYEINDYNNDTDGYAYTYFSFDQTMGSTVHLDNLNNVALKYCNKNYVKGGICNSDAIWAMRDLDFEKITKNKLSSTSCYGNDSFSNKLCGYTNDLIDNGGYYWIATAFDNKASNYIFNWNPSYRGISNNYSNKEYGIRPVIQLSSSIVVVGGSGSYNDPFVIDVIN